PVSYFGRIKDIPTDKDRITLPEIMEKIEGQTEGLVNMNNLKAPCCENSLCSFNGSFIFDNGSLNPVSKRNEDSCKCSIDALEGATKAKKYVAGNWKISSVKKATKQDPWEALVNELKTRTFSISAMAFQDVYNVSIERLKDCCIHVVNKEGNLVPFCIYNITDISGSSIYRQ
ncbi:MAG: hypothetical protein WC151_12655, partial [Bacteroidales bacterium]